MRRAPRGAVRLGRLAGALLLIAGCGPLAGCGNPAGSTAAGNGVGAGSGAPSPFADCAALTGAPLPAEPAARPLPDLTLPCFTGGRPVRLREVRGPVVVNLWQSACAPCREELPAFQRLADRFPGQLHVLGVVIRDSREAARSFGEDLRIGFPNLDDPEMRLPAALGRTVLPLTVLVDAGGSVAHVYAGPALDDDRLDRLVRAHLGLE